MQVVNEILLELMFVAESLIQRSLINKLYFDLDCDIKKGQTFDKSKLREVWQNTQILAKTIKAVFGASPRVYFSGRKGFGIYIDYKEPYLISKDSFHFISKRFIQKIMIASCLCKDVPIEKFDEFDYGFIDTSVLGHFSRVSRLPYTKHTKSELLCYPVDIDRGIDKILSEARSHAPEKIEHPKFGVDFNLFLKKIETEEFPIYQKMVSEKYKHTSSDNLDEDLDLILSLAPHIKDGRRRIIHALIIPRLVTLGKSPESIRQYCKLFIELTGDPFDYEMEQYVKYQTDYRRGRGSIPWSWGAFFQKFPDLMKAFKYAERQNKVVD